MRWPFGPPHLTLKPSKKQKKTETGTTTSNHKTKQSKQTEIKPKPKSKTKTRRTKHPNLPTQINKKKPPHKAPKLGEKKQAILTLFQLHQTKHNDLKPEKTNKKQPFAMFKNNPLFFINFLFFVYIQCLYCNCCVSLKTL